jgi:hypothetical protein
MELGIHGSILLLKKLRLRFLGEDEIEKFENFYPISPNRMGKKKKNSVAATKQEKIFNT